MLDLKLFIGDKRVDFFEDESVQLTDSIQDAKDIGKIFTAVSQDFTVPATLINNNLFKHFYNFDILDGFDPRQKVRASLFQNGFLYKKGFVQLRSVNLENNKASSYKIFFTGLLGELKSIFKNDKLSDLGELDNYSHPYNVVTIRAGLQNYFDVVNNVPDFSTPNSKDLCYPFVSSVNRYAFGADGLRTVDENGLLTTDKIQTSDLKPALRATRIIEAIEEKYSITFDSDFFKTNEVFTELYLWLNRSKGVLADETKFDLSYLIPDFTYSSGDQVLSLANNTITTDSNSSGGTSGSINFNFQYKVNVTGKGAIELQIINGISSQILSSFSQEVDNEEISIQYLFESEDGNLDSTVWKPSIKIITQTEEITEINIDLIVKKTQTQNNNPFVQTGNYELTDGPVVAISKVNVSLQIPSMLVLDFLTSIFKTFNLTAFVQNDSSIKVQPLDEFYAEGKVMDITNQIDISKSQVKRFEPYREINFEFEKSQTLLMVERDKSLDDIFGNLNFKIASESTTKNIEGGVYNVKSKFNKILPERLRIEDGSLSPIMYSWYVNQELEPLSNEPLLFYTNRQSFQSTSLVEFENGEDLSSNISPSNVKQDSSQTINYGAEIDEYTLKINNNSLFNNFYRTFILGAFSPLSKTLSVDALLDEDFILNYKLSDTIVIDNRKFHINTLDVNGGNGKAKIELRNIFTIPPIVVQPPPSFQTLTISSPSQSENDASGTYTFTVFSNVSWSVSESSDFISVSPTTGSNDGTLTVTYLENDTTESRSGSVTVEGGGFTRVHTLTQSGKPVELTISSPSNTVGTRSGSYDIQILSNTNWIVSDNKSWTSQSPTNGFGNTTPTTLTITRSKNLTTTERVAIIEVQAGSVVRTHTLTQEAQTTSQIFSHDLAQGSTKNNACSESFSQIYYTDNTTYSDSTVIFFDDEGNFRVSAGFYAKGTDVLETNNNGEVITSQLC